MVFLGEVEGRGLEMELFVRCLKCGKNLVDVTACSTSHTCSCSRRQISSPRRSLERNCSHVYQATPLKPWSGNLDISGGDFHACAWKSIQSRIKLDWIILLSGSTTELILEQHPASPPTAFNYSSTWSAHRVSPGKES